MGEVARKSPLHQEIVSQIRVRHYNRRTEDSYLYGIKRFIYFHNKRHPKEMSEREVGQFLTDPAAHRNVAASTQNIALNAIAFL